MKRCLTCKRKLLKTENNMCKTCLEFFKWKYGSKFKEKIEYILKNTEKEPLSSIKFRRKK